MKIAIIGAGISGLAAGYWLHRQHEITVFEANDYVGGHTNTIDVEIDGQYHAIDTGFIVFNDRTYPRFIRLLNELGVQSQPTEMSFSVHCERTGMEYSGTGLNGLLSQRSNLVNPRFWRLITDWLRFSREARQLLRSTDESSTVSDFLSAGKYSAEFRDWYFLPMGSAVWSCPQRRFSDFPMHFIAEFYENHGLLNVFDRPQWRVVSGGSKTYVKALIQGFAERIRTRTAIASVRRSPDEVQVLTRAGNAETFDYVIFACHSDQALRILGAQATPTEQELLSAFPYQRNVAVLHTDASVLPRKKRAWASWNYFVPQTDADAATVTYYMNRLQGISASHDFCVTLNGESHIDPAKILGRFEYDHPSFSVSRSAAQNRHHEVIGPQRTSFCGAYWRNGFHEDGVESAWRVCKHLKNSLQLVLADTEPGVVSGSRG